VVDFGASETGEDIHGATWLASSVALASQGVAAVKRMVGICGLDAGVVNGDGDREQIVSVVARESSCKGISQ